MIEKMGYWVSLGLFSLMMTGSGMGFLSGSEQMVENLRHLGYPDYLRTLLGVAKLLGVVALLAPGVPVLLREWAYAGFAILMVGAAISHLASGDPVGRAAAPLLALALLVTARVFWRTRGEHRSLASA
jgi:hypothetical protein